MDWQEIWRNKANQHSAGDLSLEEILRVNGYDVKYAETGVETIRAFTRKLIEKLQLSEGDHLLEVGSGAGAISIPMVENGIRVTGFDLCPELIEIAMKALPEQTFFVAEAADFDIEKKDFDAALSQGVFQFFSSEQYGIDSIKNMITHVRSGGIVAVTDVLDKQNKQQLMEERIRLLGEVEYQERYVKTGLQHQFYGKDEISRQISPLCSSLKFECQFLENATAAYKYNIIIQK